MGKRRREVAFRPELMKRITKYLIRVAIALLAFIAGVALFLFAPNPFSGIATVPSAAPIAFVPSDLNKGKQCQADRLIVSRKLGLADNEVIDPVCAPLQVELVRAAESGDIDTMRALIARGANPRATVADDSFNYLRPLPMAARSKEHSAVQLLLDNGGDVNDYYSCCMTRESLLMIAVTAHDVEMVKLLLARGADAKFEGYIGETAFDIAAREGQDEIIRWLDQSGRLSQTERAEARLASLPGSNIKKVHRVFIRLSLAKNIFEDPSLRW